MVHDRVATLGRPRDDASSLRSPSTRSTSGSPESASTVPAEIVEAHDRVTFGEEIAEER
jgi:hypothetical protein